MAATMGVDGSEEVSLYSLDPKSDCTRQLRRASSISSPLRAQRRASFGTPEHMEWPSEEAANWGSAQLCAGCYSILRLPVPRHIARAANMELEAKNLPPRLDTATMVKLRELYGGEQPQGRLESDRLPGCFIFMGDMRQYSLEGIWDTSSMIASEERVD
ncbi:MAG: hypothetical protein SGPRY_005312 [Prymnesium sp.]